MPRKTIPNIVFLIAVNLLVKPFWIFGVDRVVQNDLGETTYGLYFALFNFSMFFQILNDFGIQNYNSRHVAMQPDSVAERFASLIAGKFMLSGGYLLISIAVFLLLGYSWQEHGHLFLILLVNQVLISMIYFLRSNLAGLHHFRLDAFFSVFDKLLMILFVGSILYFNVLDIPLTITNFVLAQTLAFTVNALLLTAAVFSIARIQRITVDPAIVRRALRESIPFALSVFLMSIYLRMDAIMIERLLGGDGAYAAGIYAQSFRIIDALNMVGILFANVLLPTYARAINENRPVNGLVGQAALMMAVFTVPVAAALLFSGQPVIELLYVNDPQESGRILTILSVSFVAYSFMHIFSSYLTAAGRLRQLNIVFGCGIALNLAANLVLIPRLGASGAAITTSASQCIVLLAIAVMAVRMVRSAPAERSERG